MAKQAVLAVASDLTIVFGVQPVKHSRHPRHARPFVEAPRKMASLAVCEAHAGMVSARLALVDSPWVADVAESLVIAELETRCHG